MIMEWEYHITAPDGGDPIPIILKMLESYDELKPCSVHVDSGHAGHVEFGTEPANTTPRYNLDSMNKTISPVKQAIREWAATKFGLSDPGEIARAGDRIYHNIMTNGMLPIPYLRPAMYDVKNELESEDYSIVDIPHLNGVVWAICEKIADRAKEIITANDTIYTEELRDSIEVMDPSDVPVSSSPDSTSTGTIPESIWQSEDLAKDGIRRPRPSWRHR